MRAVISRLPMRQKCGLSRKCARLAKLRFNHGLNASWTKLRRNSSKPPAYGAGVKKPCWHTTLGDICVDEPQYRNGSKRIRPFAQGAQVSNRGCSRPLQRVVTDFGADLPLAQAMDRIVEHHGVVLSESTIARLTEGHARAMFDAAPEPQGRPALPGISTAIIVETDGGMVPIVEIDGKQADKRKGRKLLWREAKIDPAHPQGSKTLVFGGTLQGDVDVAGQCLLDCAVRAGFGTDTPIHGVGDGAPWIADQIEKGFGAQGSYLIDFLHACDYPSAAGKAINSDEQAQKAWMDAQKNRLKTQQATAVLQELQTHPEPPAAQDNAAPVRQCHRYPGNRPDQLNYQEAIERDLPIGSGEIESAHRYIVQQRMKRPGAWWRAHNAEHMLALRLNRANRQWDSYWQQISKKQQYQIATSV